MKGGNMIRMHGFAIPEEYQEVIEAVGITSDGQVFVRYKAPMAVNLSIGAGEGNEQMELFMAPVIVKRLTVRVTDGPFEQFQTPKKAAKKAAT